MNTKPACFIGMALWGSLIILLNIDHEGINLASAPILLILIASLYSFFLSLRQSLFLSALAVLMFNYQLVPPVHTLHVDMQQHGVLLLTLMVVTGSITYLLKRQKALADLAQLQTQRTVQLMNWSEALREADDPRLMLPHLHELLLQVSPVPIRVVLGFQIPEEPVGCVLSPRQLEGFLTCLKDNKALGKNTGRYEDLDDLYLPMRGRLKAFGVCLITCPVSWNDCLLDTNPIQALLDQIGLACERRENFLRIQSERESAQNQKTRSLFLTSIAHDQRTPLASIMTSASALAEQSTRLAPEQVKHSACLIYTEAEQVLRLTDNTLTLARLSGEQVHVPMQAESAEDIVAAVLQRMRQRNVEYLPEVRVEPDLPLFDCNVVLVEQVIDNLLENALRHSGAPATVSLRVHRVLEQVLFEVSDKGRGIDPRQMEQGGDRQRGLGIGLSLCRAVANVHRGELRIEDSGECGSRIVFSLPVGVAGA